MKTLIQGGEIVAYHAGGHRLLRGGVLLIEDDRVAFVGRRHDGPVDRRIDATGKLVIPGLVNIHCHATTEAGGRLIADVGRRDFFQNGFLNYNAAPPGVPGLDQRADRALGGRFALVEMLRNGCTTVVEMGAADDALVATAGEIGLRAYLTPGYKSATYRLGRDGQLVYEWDEADGLRGLARARRFVERHHGAHGDRIRGMLFPLQVDTCSPELLRATRKAADELSVGIEIHAGQNLLEFHEMLRRHGRTPVEYLADIGLLGRDAILGHCIISTAHHLAALPQGRDLELLAASGTSIAHCPLVFARRGKKDPPASGGWHLMPANWISADVMTPAVNTGLAGGCDKAWFGWPCIPELEKLRAEWMRATDPARRKQIAEQIQVVAYDEVPYVPWGQYTQPTAYRRNVRGVLRFPATILWNIALET